MKTFTFDKRGNLTPYDIIKTDPSEFKYNLVTNFRPPTTREEIYSGYKIYIKDFSENISKEWYQWINGSFITIKQDPGDIDLVNFVDVNILEKNNAKVRKFRTKYGSKNKYKVDGYILPVVDKSHKDYNEVQKVVNYWKNLFGHTRKDEQTQKQYPKGFFQIDFNENILKTV